MSAVSVKLLELCRKHSVKTGLNAFSRNIRLTRVKLVVILNLSQIIPGFTCLQNKSFENTVGKGEIARNEQFRLFPQCFLPVWRTFWSLSSNLKLSSADSFSLEESKICCLGKG